MALYCLTFPTRKMILLLWKCGSVPSPLQTWFQTALELCHKEPLAYYTGRMPDKLAEVWLVFKDFQFESYAVHNVIRSDWNVIPYFLLLKFNCFLIPLSSLHLTNTCASLVRYNTQSGFVFKNHCGPFFVPQRKKEKKKEVLSIFFQKSCQQKMFYLNENNEHKSSIIQQTWFLLKGICSLDDHCIQFFSS